MPRRSNPSRASRPKKSLDENAGFSQIDKELFYNDLIDDSSDKVSSDEDSDKDSNDESKTSKKSDKVSSDEESIESDEDSDKDSNGEKDSSDDGTSNDSNGGPSSDESDEEAELSPVEDVINVIDVIDANDSDEDSDGPMENSTPEEYLATLNYSEETLKIKNRTAIPIADAQLTTVTPLPPHHPRHLPNYFHWAIETDKCFQQKVISYEAGPWESLVKSNDLAYGNFSQFPS